MYQAARGAVIGVVCGASKELKHGAHRNSTKDSARLGGGIRMSQELDPNPKSRRKSSKTPCESPSCHLAFDLFSI